MFARLLARKKKANYVEDDKDRKLMSYMTIVPRLDGKIKQFAAKAEGEREKRKNLMLEAMKYKKANQIAMVKAKLRGVENCDKLLKQLESSVQRLEDMKYTYEAFLTHTDFMEVCSDVKNLVDGMGIDIEKAEEIIDGIQDLKEKVDELNGTLEMEEGDDEQMNELMGELNSLIDEEEKESAKAQTLPSVPSTVVNAPAVTTSAAEELDMDLESMLADL